MDITKSLLEFVTLYPKMATFIGVLGTARLIIHPLTEVLKVIVEATPNKWDDELLEKTLGSKSWNFSMSILEWFGSFDLGKFKL